MRTDIASAIKEQDETLVSITLAEKKKQEEIRRSEESSRDEEAGQSAQREDGTSKPRGRVLLIVIIILILSGGGITLKFLLPKLSTVNLHSVSISNFNPSNQPMEQATTTITVKPAIILAPSLIPAQSEKRLGTSKSNPEHIFALITVERTAGLASDNIENLYFTEEVSTQEGDTPETLSLAARKFISFAGVPAPEILTRSLNAPFMAGLFGEGGGATPFIILKVSSYETGLAGMLAFEEYIPYLFNTVFGMKIETQTTGKKLAFHNIVVLGRDARSFGGDPRQSIAYAFADAETIVIAGSQNALGKIMLLVAGK